MTSYRSRHSPVGVITLRVERDSSVSVARRPARRVSGLSDFGVNADSVVQVTDRLGDSAILGRVAEPIEGSSARILTSTNRSLTQGGRSICML